MRIALLGDVHGNLPALEAVLEHARQQNVDAIWNVGDFVGYGPFPEEVIRRLRKEKALSIIGNYDLKVLKVKRKEGQWSQSKIPEKWLAFKWAYDHLSKKSRKYLRSLPLEERFVLKGWKILLTHGSPDSINEHLTLETPILRLGELAGLAKANAVICGHSHQPFVRYVKKVWFVNTGSVGRPDDGDPRACYAVLHLKRDTFNVVHFRVAYDVERAAAALRVQGLPEEFAQMLLEGRNLDAIQAAHWLS